VEFRPFGGYLAVVDAAPPRLLYRKSAYAHADRLDRAMLGEREAISAEYQAMLSDRADQARRDLLMHKGGEVSNRINTSLDHFGQLGSPVLVHSQLRVIRRATASARRRLADGTERSQ
jgi:hypothetical protein